MGKMFSSRIRRILAAFVILGAMTSSAFAPPLRMAPRVEPLFPRIERVDPAPFESHRSGPDWLSSDPDSRKNDSSEQRILRPSPRVVPVD